MSGLVGLGAQTALQFMDLQTAADTMKERTNSLFKNRGIGVPNRGTVSRWKNIVNRPTRSNFITRMMLPKLSSAKEYKMNHTKLASIIYKNGHMFSNTEKTAGLIAEGVKAIKNAPLLLPMAALGAYAAGRHMYDAYTDAEKAENAYKGMFEKFPELQQVDQSKIDDYWNIMREYSPAMTHNPIVAGQFIKNMVDFGMEGIDHPTLKSLIDIQDSRNRAFSAAPLSMADVARMVG